jgi:hypothetical protein
MKVLAPILLFVFLLLLNACATGKVRMQRCQILYGDLYECEHLDAHADEAQAHWILRK